MNRIKTFLCQYWPSVIVVCVILYATLSSDPTGDVSIEIPHLDKLIHAIMMGGLVAAIAFDYKRAERQRQLTFSLMRTIALYVMVACIADELAQAYLTDSRSGDVLDLLADWGGVWIAVFTAPPAINRVLRRR